MHYNPKNKIKWDIRKIQLAMANLTPSNERKLNAC
jgi:hypothetical protein